jgi:hypothetical protein
MWVFSVYGFFSAVCGRGKRGEVLADTIMIRARSKAHLEALRRRFPVLLRGVRIKATPANDYGFRVVVPKLIWCEVSDALAREVEYANFKDAAKRARPEDAAYLHALHEVWEAMNAVQRPLADRWAAAEELEANYAALADYEQPALPGWRLPEDEELLLEALR